MIHLLRRQRVEDRPRLVEALQGEGGEGEILVRINRARIQAQALASGLRAFLVLPLLAEH